MEWIVLTLPASGVQSHATDYLNDDPRTRSPRGELD